MHPWLMEQASQFRVSRWEQAVVCGSTTQGKTAIEVLQSSMQTVAILLQSTHSLNSVQQLSANGIRMLSSSKNTY